MYVADATSTLPRETLAVTLDAVIVSRPGPDSGLVRLNTLWAIQSSEQPSKAQTSLSVRFWTKMPAMWALFISSSEQIGCACGTVGWANGSLTRERIPPLTSNLRAWRSWSAGHVWEMGSMGLGAHRCFVHGKCLRDLISSQNSVVTLLPA